eukprot:scaffold109724_cov27-Tisochrysis_lutea.AAC.1
MDPKSTTGDQEGRKKLHSCNCLQGSFAEGGQVLFLAYSLNAGQHYCVLARRRTCKWNTSLLRIGIRWNIRLLANLHTSCLFAYILHTAC